MGNIAWAFGAGLAFSLGVGFGAWLVRMTLKEVQIDVDRMMKHYDCVENRLAMYVANTGSISDALWKIADSIAESRRED